MMRVLGGGAPGRGEAAGVLGVFQVKPLSLLHPSLLTLSPPASWRRWSF